MKKFFSLPMFLSLSFGVLLGGLVTTIHLRHVQISDLLPSDTPITVTVLKSKTTETAILTWIDPTTGRNAITVVSENDADPQWFAKLKNNNGGEIKLGM